MTRSAAEHGADAMQLQSWEWCCLWRAVPLLPHWSRGAACVGRQTVERLACVGCSLTEAVLLFGCGKTSL